MVHQMDTVVDPIRGGIVTAKIARRKSFPALFLCEAGVGLKSGADVSLISAKMLKTFRRAQRESRVERWRPSNPFKYAQGACR